MAHANRGDAVPQEHLLLRDARAALFRDEFRKALIDAVTAAEVALGRGIRERLDGLADRPELIDRVLKNATGVLMVFDLYSVLGKPPSMSRERVMDRLAEKRNKAVHGGVVPTLHR